jgi:hypothetical protein
MMSLFKSSAAIDARSHLCSHSWSGISTSLLGSDLCILLLVLGMMREMLAGDHPMRLPAHIKVVQTRT